MGGVHQFVPPLALEPLFRRLGLPTSWCGEAGLHDIGVQTLDEMVAGIRTRCPTVTVNAPLAELSASGHQAGRCDPEGKG